VVRALLGAAARSGVELRGGARVTALRRDRGGEGWAMETADGATLRAPRVILATGGLSLPKTGSDGAGLAMARRLGHTVVATRPALVPLLGGDERWRALAGVSADARLTVRRDGSAVEERTGSVLFTHRGFSGPAVLDVSRHFTGGDAAGARLEAQWGGGAPGDWDRELAAGGRGTTGSVLRARLPRSLASALLERAGVEADGRVAELSRADRARLVEVLERCPLPVAGDEGYRTAEVTAGGIPLGETVTGTLESRVAPGLFLCGEMLDVTGRLGGYNFLWAWVSGRRAGEGAGR
jgi:predicted Rossmann fold flavoprotein